MFLNYEQAIEYARKNYNKGGDAFCECWDSKDFDEYVSLFGRMTKGKMQDMFRVRRERLREYRNM